MFHKQRDLPNSCLLLFPGCPAAVANLWDVTDVDIDRFARGVLDQWLGEVFCRLLS